jgi:hypothetical protein
MLDDLAVAHPHDVDELPLDAIARWRQSPQLPGVRATERLACRDQIPLGELLVDIHCGVREALQQHAVEPLEASGRAAGRIRNRPPSRLVMVDELGMEDLIGVREIVLVLAHLYEAGHDPLVLVG